MKTAELRGKDQPELLALINSKQKELNALYAETRTKEVKNVHVFKGLKRDIARIQTILKQKSLIDKEGEA